MRVARAILPATNLAISKTIQLFSGEPSMTLKVFTTIRSSYCNNTMLQIAQKGDQISQFFVFQVAPFFLVGAEYGHLLTVRRLCALGKISGPQKKKKIYSDPLENRFGKWIMMCINVSRVFHQLHHPKALLLLLCSDKHARYIETTSQALAPFVLLSSLS